MHHCVPPACSLLQVVKGQIWTFDQTQSFPFAVFTPVRMTVIKLKSGGLWVHAPVAPTQVCSAGSTDTPPPPKQLSVHAPLEHSTDR
jgi:hypothetical protein